MASVQPNQSDRHSTPRTFDGQRLALPSDQDASGRSFGDDDLDALKRVLDRGTLVSTKGPEAKTFEAAFAQRHGVAHAIASASGTSAIHAAVAAVDPEPGDEIVTTAITDMGALTPILAQGAIPVFADVDPRTGNVTAAGIEAALSERTRAIVVTHLFGAPCEMPEIAALARARSIPIIEDCAQAFLASSHGRLVGTIGDFGAFSFQQGKHMTSGEGGITICADPVAARRMYLWVNKGYGYGNEQPDHDFLALNMRMTELQGALLGSQLPRLDAMVETRRRNAALLTEALAAVPGLRTPSVHPDDRHSFWRYCIGIDPAVIPGGPGAVAADLARLGVASAPRYIQKPAFECRVFTEQRTFGSSGWPFTLARPGALDHGPDRLPGTYQALREMLVLPWNERYTESHVEQLASAIVGAVERVCA